MTKRLLWVTGALFSLLGATNAAAIGSTYGATFQGTVSGTDTLGLFGAVGGNLNGASYSEMFLINTLAGTKRTGSNQQDEIGYTGNFITASLTISGKTVTVYSSIYGETFVNDGGNVSNASTGITYSAGYGGTNAYHAVYDYTEGSTSIPGSYIATMASYADNSTASFAGFPATLDQPFTTSVGANGTTGAGTFTVYTDCFAEVETLALHETVAAAPEPASWVILLAGVAGLGSVLRWRRGRPTPRAAA